MTSPDQHAAKMIENMPAKTGRPLSEWLAIIQDTGFRKHSQIVAQLKNEHALGHGFARLIASEFLKSDTPIDLVAAQYSGMKAPLQPIYFAIVEFALALGEDVKVAPKKSSVSLRRKTQFAWVTPATQKRVDLGLALKGEAASERLETYNDMCSHRVRLFEVEQFDDEVKGYLRLGYDRAG